jgi:ATP-dependent exoDNAse (exonuclease V) alpha subunit
VAEQGAELGDDQAAAITAIATSGRLVDLLVGPAGTGKTTSLAALKTAWETSHGPGSVVGLAPSAAAAQVLTDELGIGAENTAKWLTEHRRNPDRAHHIDQLAGELARCSSLSTVHAQRLAARVQAATTELDRWRLHPGQLVLLDEASLAGTLTLDVLREHAKTVGAKIVLVGDWAQLGAIEAGGAFHLLATRRADTPELRTVRRFTEAWEADASTRLRTGDPTVIDTYLAHDRIHDGTSTDMLHAVFDAWRHDTDHGLTSAMIAPDDATVAALNALAQAHRQDTGFAQPGTIPAADGHHLGIGDLIVTRRNDRRLRTGSSWVKNGDTWTIHAATPNGITVINAAGEQATLLTGYVEHHVELGYATTIHRGQGSTVDTAHARITATSTRERSTSRPPGPAPPTTST